MVKYLKFGGVSFENNVSPEEINKFVRDLPEHDKNSIFEVVSKLKNAGLINVYEGDSITIDQDQQQLQEPNGGDGE